MKFIHKRTIVAVILLTFLLTLAPVNAVFQPSARVVDLSAGLSFSSEKAFHTADGGQFAQAPAQVAIPDSRNNDPLHGNVVEITETTVVSETVSYVAHQDWIIASAQGGVLATVEDIPDVMVAMDYMGDANVTDGMDAMDYIGDMDYIDNLDYIDDIDYTDNMDYIDYIDYNDYMDYIDYNDYMDYIDCIDYIDHADKTYNTDSMDSTDNTNVVDKTNVTYRDATVLRPDASAGSYIWPATGNLTSEFGYRSATVGSSNHKGIDICAQPDDPIYATDSGDVIVSDWSDSYGYYIEIRHDNGHVTLYAHCNLLLVSVGDRVGQGSQIALMGRTGRATAVHVHFELRINGESVDPVPYLSKL